MLRSGGWLSSIARTAMCGIFALLGLEACSRIIHRGARPMLPAVIEVDGVPHLPTTWSSGVRFPEGGLVEITTGRCGERIASPAAPQGRLVVVGDSQALGWGVAFNDTFGAVVGRARLGDDSAVRLLAAPAHDPDRMQSSVACYLGEAPHPEQAILSLNLGNDLDELFLNRQYPTYNEHRMVLNRWMGSSSFFFLDLILLRHRITGPPPFDPQHTMTLLRTSPDDQAVLQEGIVESVRTLRARLAPAHLQVVLIPTDFDVEPSELSKYAPPGSISQSAMHEIAGAARAFRERLVVGLRTQGFSVVDLGLVGRGAAFAHSHYQRTSHHLTREGHALVAKLLLEENGSEH